VTLRRRLALIAGVAVAAAIALASLVAYLAVRGELRGQVDDDLRAQAMRARQFVSLTGAIPGDPQSLRPPGVLRGLNESDLAVGDVGPPLGLRVIAPDGAVVEDRGELTVPMTERAVDVAEGDDRESFQEATVADEHVRVLTAELPGGGAVQLVRSLASVDDTLADLRIVLFLVFAGGAVLAAVTARALAQRVLAPVARLDEAAAHVAETEDLTRRIEVTGEDELADLGRRFNAMLARLEHSRAELDESHSEQRRLIADASHELRTPVTSLRTNIEVLADGEVVEADRERLIADVVVQTEELSELVGDLVDLARGEGPSETREPVRLDELAAESVERARRHSPELEFELDARPAIVDGDPERLARALNNLLDNAAAHGAGPVLVSVDGQGVRVRDHGPGLAAGEAEHLFERFYRGNRSRETPGSGLGLAIVKQVVESHGGSATARNAEGGGAEFELNIPGSAGVELSAAERARGRRAPARPAAR
jgi:two-component system sensor histidine kinase MprB